MLPVWWGNLMEVFSDIGLGPIRADGGWHTATRGQKTKIQSQIQIHKYNYIKHKYKYKNPNTKGVTHSNQGTKDKNVRTEFFAAIIGIDISQTLPLAICRNNEILNIDIVLSDQSDGWMDGPDIEFRQLSRSRWAVLLVLSSLVSSSLPVCGLPSTEAQLPTHLSGWDRRPPAGATNPAPHHSWARDNPPLWHLHIDAFAQIDMIKYFSVFILPIKFLSVDKYLILSLDWFNLHLVQYTENNLCQVYLTWHM